MGWSDVWGLINVLNFLIWVSRVLRAKTSTKLATTRARWILQPRQDIYRNDLQMMCSRRWQSEPSCMESSATPLMLCRTSTHKEEETSSILQLGISGFVFTAECLFPPFFHLALCPVSALLCPAATAAWGPMLSASPHSPAWEQKLNLLSDRVFWPSSRPQGSSTGAQPEGRMAGLCRPGSPHRTYFPILPLT